MLLYETSTTKKRILPTFSLKCMITGTLIPDEVKFSVYLWNTETMK